MRRYGGLYHLHPNPDTEAGNPAAFAHCRGGVFLWILDPENRFLGLTCSCFFIEPLDTLPGADPDDAWNFLLSCGGYELILCGAAEGDYLCWGAGGVAGADFPAWAGPFSSLLADGDLPVAPDGRRRSICRARRRRENAN